MRFWRLQRSERPASNKSNGAAQKNVPQGKRLIEQQPKEQKAGARNGKGHKTAHVGPITLIGRSAAEPRTLRI